MKLWRPYRYFGAAIKMLRRAGLDVQPLRTKAMRVSGMKLQWRDEEATTLRGAIVDADVEGQPLKLFVANDFDAIQQHHRKGELYELEELAIIKRAWGQTLGDGTFLDVGANVGNHTLYALLVLGAERVIACEPQDDAARIFEANVALNNCADRVTLHRFGLSDSTGQASLKTLNNNLGATRLEPGEGGIELAVGDELIGERPIGFIKVDTEGFELPVLRGLATTIARDRPPIFVEVELPNLAAFEQFCAEHGYTITERFQRYETSVNCLAISERRD